MRLLALRRVRNASGAICFSTAVTIGSILEYSFREDGDVESVNVWTACAKCGKRTRRFTADIDYGTGEATGTLFSIDYSLERVVGEHAVPKVSGVPCLGARPRRVARGAVCLLAGAAFLRQPSRAQALVWNSLSPAPINTVHEIGSGPLSSLMTVRGVGGGR